MVASNEDRLIYLPALDRYFYYNTIPEDTNKYDESSPRVKALQKLLLDYIASDCCDPNSAATADDVSGTNRFPYGPKRADHLMRQAEERARIRRDTPSTFDLSLVSEGSLYQPSCF